MSDLESRFTAHQVTPEQADAMSAVRAGCLALAEFLVAKVPAGREQALVLTKVEEAMFHANAGIARAGA